MAHVIHSINITLSGTCYHGDAIADEEHHAYALDLVRSSAAVALGRNTFELFDTFWPSAVGNPELKSYNALPTPLF